MKLKVRFSAAVLCLLLILSMTGCSDAISSALEDAGLLQEEKQVESVSLEDVPEYSGDEYIEIDGGVPDFSDDGDFQPGYEYYSDLDSLERCGLTEALVGPETMPTEERGSIGMIKPTGWHTVRYDFVDGKYLYNRCHLIGFQLAGENANEIKATLASEVTAFGEYTLTIPAQAILQVDGEEGQTVVDYSPALKYTFTLTDGEGIGEVLADAETADVYTVSGILVKKDAKADDLKGLKKGIYIVNGKKVAIK